MVPLKERAHVYLPNFEGTFPLLGVGGGVIVTSPRDVTAAVKSSFSPSSVTKVPFTTHTPLSSGPLGSSSIVMEAIFPCRDLVPIMYFLTTLFASSALPIRNLNQPQSIKEVVIRI